MWRNWSGPHREADARRNAKSAAGFCAVGQYRYGQYGAARDAARDAAEDQAERTVIDCIVERRHSGQSYRPIAATLDAEELSLPTRLPLRLWQSGSSHFTTVRIDGCEKGVVSQCRQLVKVT